VTAPPTPALVQAPVVMTSFSSWRCRGRLSSTFVKANSAAQAEVALAMVLFQPLGCSGLFSTSKVSTVLSTVRPFA